MAINLITMEDWAQLHPYTKRTSYDVYYTKFANQLLEALSIPFVEKQLSQEHLKEISLTITAYFEDVISGIGLWRAFTKQHRRLYGKPVPFYDVAEEEYIEDELNPEDVAFLVWSIFQNASEGSFINPDNPFLKGVSTFIFLFLDEHFEEAPINEHFQEYIIQEEHYEDIFSFRQLGLWLYYDSYLLAPFSSKHLQRSLEWLEDEDLDEVQMELFRYGIISENMLTKKTGPLSLTLKEWGMLLLEDYKGVDAYRKVSTMESVGSDKYLVESEDDTDFYLYNRKGQCFKVCKSSFKTLPSSNKEKASIVVSLIKYDNQWNANGISFWIDKEDFIEYKEEKEVWEANCKQAFDVIMKANKNYPLAYFANFEELNEWLQSTLGVNNAPNAELTEHQDLVLFASPDQDVEIIPNLARYIKDKRNPYYDKKEAVEGVAILADEKFVSQKLLDFLIDKKLLPAIRVNSLAGKKRGRELVRENRDFIIRYFRQ